MNLAKIIDIDEYKPKILGYSPSKASEFQSQSAKIANKDFEKAVKSGKYKKVILLSGGSASGKTEFIRSHLFGEKAIIFDSTLSSVEGAKIKVKKILKNKLDFEIIFIFPEKLETAYIAFLNRERKIPKEVFMRTHIGSRKTMLYFVKNGYHDKIKIIESRFTGRRLRYWLVTFGSLRRFELFAKVMQINQKIFQNIFKKYEKAGD